MPNTSNVKPVEYERQSNAFNITDVEYNRYPHTKRSLSVDIDA